MLFKQMAFIDGRSNEELNYWLSRSHTEEGLTRISEMLSEVATNEGSLVTEPPFKDEDYVVELDTELGDFIISFSTGFNSYAALTQIFE